MSDRHTLSTLIDLWAVQDSLLQSYRTIFMTSQAVLIPTALFFIGKPPVAVGPLFLVMVLGFLLAFIWIVVTRERGRIVSRLQAQILAVEAGGPLPASPLGDALTDGPLTPAERSYRDAILANRARRPFGARRGLGLLPVIFLAMWGWIGLDALQSKIFDAAICNLLPTSTRCC